ncbi:unnamed protein product [Darwinula stevensoni]|uniref:Endophilin-A n=1 Tax=Darwinula stevensoni TaxID=69355 RepID=A0A7R8X3N4_9CRUS|nr:unnamed protein product [Darwinula stevensoni]CAG0885203.1 unnamed protein product [Darwinula stevensoni]
MHHDAIRGSSAAICLCEMEAENVGFASRATGRRKSKDGMEHNAEEETERLPSFTSIRRPLDGRRRDRRALHTFSTSLDGKRREDGARIGSDPGRVRVWRSIGKGEGIPLGEMAMAHGRQPWRHDRVGSNITDEELKLAMDKFAESMHLAQVGMHNLLDNDVELISQLAAFTEALVEYHRQCSDVLTGLHERILEKKHEATVRPRQDFVPKTLNDLKLTIPDINFDGTSGRLQNGDLAPPPSYHSVVGRTGSNGTAGNNAWDPFPSAPSAPVFNSSSPITSPSRSPMNSKQPCCQALYDFEAENPEELTFKEGDMIQLDCKLDDNWYRGTVHGRSGIFPVSYVQVLVPFP